MLTLCCNYLTVCLSHLECQLWEGSDCVCLATVLPAQCLMRSKYWYIFFDWMKEFLIFLLDFEVKGTNIKILMNNLIPIFIILIFKTKYYLLNYFVHFLLQFLFPRAILFCFVLPGRHSGYLLGYLRSPQSNSYFLWKMSPFASEPIRFLSLGFGTEINCRQSLSVSKTAICKLWSWKTTMCSKKYGQEREREGRKREGERSRHAKKSRDESKGEKEKKS